MGLACRKCGYPQEGLIEGARCPECGRGNWARKHERKRWLARLVIFVSVLVIGGSLPVNCFKQRIHTNRVWHDTVWEYYLSMPPFFWLTPHVLTEDEHVGAVRVLVYRSRQEQHRDAFLVVRQPGRADVRIRVNGDVWDIRGVQLDEDAALEVAFATSSFRDRLYQMCVLDIGHDGTVVEIEPFGVSTRLSYFPVRSARGSTESLCVDWKHGGCYIDRAFGSFCFIHPCYMLEDDALVFDWETTVDRLGFSKHDVSIRKQWIALDIKSGYVCFQDEPIPECMDEFVRLIVELMFAGRAEEAWGVVDELGPADGARKDAFEAELLERLRGWEYYDVLLEVNGGSIERAG